MADERFAEHLEHPVGRGHAPARAHAGSAGGAACGDLVRIDVAVDGDRVSDAGFEASGCGAVQAAGSAVVDLIRGARILDAARIGTHEVSAALGGLSAGKLHAAELAADALHRALGAAAAADASAPEEVPGRVLVAMSGGVDSAVAALLCSREPGADVCAVTVELWRDPENDGERSCCSADAVRTARAVAHGMGLAHLTLDLRDAFRAGVVQPWLDDHARGLTPNPCVRCNGNVRLDAMLDLAQRLGAATLATGHYARVTDDGLLRAAADPAKDQAYMLAQLRPQTLRRLRFPLGALTKPEVRAIAAEADLPVASKRDSQDLCFLAGTGKAAFLARHGALRDRPGDVVDTSGAIVGRHDGVHHFTIGQRRGLPGGAGGRRYVVATDQAANRVVVGGEEDLRAMRVALRDVTLHRDASAVDAVRLRYRSPALPAHLEGDTVVLDEPVSAAAPGQQACLLQGDVVVGYATIAQ
jgi:tRNA-specific 2-thiouridylase